MSGMLHVPGPQVRLAEQGGKDEICCSTVLMRRSENLRILDAALHTQTKSKMSMFTCAPGRKKEEVIKHLMTCCLTYPCEKYS